MSFPLANATRTTVALARKSVLLANVSSGVPTSATAAQQARSLTSSGSGQSVSSLSSATFLGASLAARKFGASERRYLQDGEAPSEVHAYLKAVLEMKQKGIYAEKAVNWVKEEPTNPVSW